MSALRRRQFLKTAGLSLMGSSVSGWLPLLAAELAPNPARRRQCILLWMTGGPSQTDTFDMKPGHANGGEFEEIATSTPGVRFSEHLPRLARLTDQMAVVRSVSTKEGDHGRGTYLMRTGRPPLGNVRYPTIGSSLSKELAGDSSQSLHYVSIAPDRAINPSAFGSGFLGPRYAPLTVGAADRAQQTAPPLDGFARLEVEDLQPPAGIVGEQAARRVELWRRLQDGFLSSHRTSAPRAHDTIYRRALELMESEVAQAFQLEEEVDEVREAYGRGRFGQGCLLARRLIERGVAFVEVSLGSFGTTDAGWDTHQKNFPTVQALSRELDAGWATLMSELQERGLLETTTILWIGEFGRTPRINNQAGRDHFPAAWSCVFAGGGIRGGQAYGRTSDDGSEVIEGKVDQGDVLSTLSSALGVPPERENISDQGRPIRIAEGEPILDILAGFA